MPARAGHRDWHCASMGLGTEDAARCRRTRDRRRLLFPLEGSRMKVERRCRLPLYAFVVFVALMSAAPAEAHLNTTGMGPLYDGLVHFFLSPEDIIPVLALALLTGLRG